MKRRMLVMAALAAAVALTALPDTADARKRNNGAGWYQYAVTFTCGLNSADTERAVPATYATAVSIHNFTDADVVITKHVALSFPPVDQAPGDVSAAVVETLPAGTALQVDCGEILGPEFGLPAQVATYVQGFFVVRAASQLDVAAVYSATGATGEVSVDVEQFKGRPLDRDAMDGDKVDVCHVPRGNPGNAHTITVGVSAVPAHLAHGDTVGACD